MKRHPSLIQLSREHHGGLILARLLQADAPPYKGLPTDIKGKAEYAIRYYRNELKHHFEDEEKIIPPLKGINRDLDFLLQEMCDEHKELGQIFGSIHKETDLAGYLDSTGKKLENHIRKEERQIFPMIQESCSEDILDAVAKILAGD